VERQVGGGDNGALFRRSSFRTLGGTDGYRIILTLEMMVDSNQELMMKMHATLVSGKLDCCCYRTVCLRDITNPHTACH
jgi:hypothetical protein